MKYNIVKLKDIANIDMGQSPNGDTYNKKGEGMPFLQGNKTFGKIYPTIETWTSKPKKIAKKNTILMSVRAPVGELNIANQDICIGRGLCNITMKNENNKYLYYLLKSSIRQIKDKATGTVFDSINKKELEELSVIDFHENQQKKITQILFTLDKKIELNNQINNNLHELCNSIFHDFLNKYSDLIIDTKLVDIAQKVVTGKTPSTKNEEFWDGNIPFITIPDMHNQVFTIDTERTIGKLGAKSLIPKNSISVSCIATVGLVSITTEESQTNQQINSIIIDNDYDLYYLFEFLSEQTEYLKSIAGGSTTYNINKKTFQNIVIPYLPKEILINFSEQVSCLFEKIKSNESENRTLEQLRDTLLPKLMNGEIDLDKIEI